MGASFLLPRIVGHGRAAELLFFGDLIDAAEALPHRPRQPRRPRRRGACRRARAWAERLARGPAFAHTMTKQMLESEHAMSLAAAIEAEAQAQAICMAHPDFRDGLRGQQGEAARRASRARRSCDGERRGAGRVSASRLALSAAISSPSSAPRHARARGAPATTAAVAGLDGEPRRPQTVARAMGELGLYAHLVPEARGGAPSEKPERPDVRRRALAGARSARRSARSRRSPTPSSRCRASARIRSSLAGTRGAARRYLPGVVARRAHRAPSRSPSPRRAATSPRSDDARGATATAWVLDGEKTLISNVRHRAALRRLRQRRSGARARRASPRSSSSATRRGSTSTPIPMSIPHPIGRLALARLPRARRTRCSARSGEGFTLAMQTLDAFRISVGAAANGMAARALARALEHVTRRRQFGAPLAEQQMVRALPRRHGDRARRRAPARRARRAPARHRAARASRPRRRWRRCSRPRRRSASSTARSSSTAASAWSLGTEVERALPRDPAAPHLRGHDRDPEAHHRQGPPRSSRDAAVADLAMWKPPKRIRHALPVLSRAPRADGGRAARSSSRRSRSRPASTLRERSWVPAMVPWRATEEGFVTPDVLDWYGRFADGRARRDRRRGDRASATCRAGRCSASATIASSRASRELVRDGARSGARGRTRLFIQLIDFLRIRRRPERDALPRASSSRSPRPTGGTSPSRRGDAAAGERDRGARSATQLARARRRDARRGPRPARDRGAALRLPRARHRRGARPHPRPAAGAARTSSRDAAERAQRGRLRRRRAPLRARLHDGLVPLGAEHARRRLRRRARAAACGSRSRSTPRCARASASAFTRRLPLPLRRRHRGRQPASTTRPTSASRFARAGMDFLSLSTGGKFEDAKQPKVGEAAYPYTGPERLRVHAHGDRPTRAGRSAGRCRSRRAIRAAVRGGGPRHADRRRRGHRHVRSGRGDPRARRGRPHRRRAPVARRSRLVPEAAPRARATRSAAASTRTTARRSTRSTSR